MLNRLPAGDYPAYYEGYIAMVPEGDLATTLEDQRAAVVDLLSATTEIQADFRYAPGKWSLKEVIGHITDTERIMGYRLLRIGRGDQTPLAGYDDEEYVRLACFESRPLAELVEDFSTVRRSTLSLIRSLPEAAWNRRGIANNGEFSVRAIAYIIAGHELHHMKIVKEKYLV